MAALTSSRAISSRTGDRNGDPIAADTVVYRGALVCLNAAGNAVPASTATGLKARGVSETTVVNAGGPAGAFDVNTQTGIFQFDNSAAGDGITRADIGAIAWIVDDCTVARTNAGATRSAAGTIIDVDARGVWVRIG